MSYFVNTEEKELLKKLVKEKKTQIEKTENAIPTATAVEAYDDRKLTAKIEANRTDFLGRFRRLDERVTTIEKEEKEEKVFFKEIEDRIKTNAKGIEKIEDKINTNAIGIEQNKDGIKENKDGIKKNKDGIYASSQMLAKAVKDMEAKQQKEITDRMNEMKEMQLKLEFMNGELNRKVTSVLDARRKVLNPSGK